MQGYERDQWRGSGYGPRGDMEEAEYHASVSKENKSTLAGYGVGLLFAAVLIIGEYAGPSSQKMDDAYPNRIERVVYRLLNGKAYPISESQFEKRKEAQQYEVLEAELNKMTPQLRMETIKKREALREEFEFFGIVSNKNNYNLMQYDIEERSGILKLAALSDQALQKELDWNSQKKLSSHERKEHDRIIKDDIAEIREERDNIVAGRPMRSFKPNAWNFNGSN